MKKIKIGELQQQKNDFKAFIPYSFPPKDGFLFSHIIERKNNTATRLLGKLDGITQLLPNMDFFLFMYIRKDAASSSQIEGTKATMIDAIEAEAKVHSGIPADVDDILHYINALNYGIKRIDHFIRSCSENYSKDCYILKLDIRGYFMSINRKILFDKI